MKILLFGKNGQVGWELNRSLQPLGEVIALSRQEADFSKPESLREIIQSTKPDIIVNAVAYTAVDKAESEEELAKTINAEAPAVVAEEALNINALLVHYSTDYVFDGSKGTPYTEEDMPCPVNVYGRTKLAGEVAVQLSGCDYLIFRTSWVYASRGHNFLLTILKLAKERGSLSVVSDQIGSPTSARLIAETTALCVYQAMKERRAETFISELYHLSASGCTSWHGFAEAIVESTAKDLALVLNVKGIKPISTENYPTPAMRPMSSRLIPNKLESVFGIELPGWKTSLKLCLVEIKAIA